VLIVGAPTGISVVGGEIGIALGPGAACLAGPVAGTGAPSIGGVAPPGGLVEDSPPTGDPLTALPALGIVATLLTGGPEMSDVPGEACVSAGLIATGCC
jgi:hypothetical protein